MVIKLNTGNESDKCFETIRNIFRNDADAAYFFWNCRENSISYIGGKKFIPENETHPFEYIREKGLVSPEFMPVFDIFCAGIEEGIYSGTDSAELSLEIKFRFSDDEDFRFCHLYNVFSKDDKGRITAVFCKYPPIYTERGV